ncbi:DNA-binding response regulator [bacterium]|nr:MAG: DNA-binding response regulator [bacterium]
MGNGEPGTENERRAVKILLLEDDANLGFILQEHLELEGYSVTLCTNGEEGSKAARKGRYDLCLVDVMMPKKDGFAFAREIRKTDQQTPLIFLTAKSLKEDRIEGFKIGCDDYVTKPFSMEELMLRIRAVLTRAKPAVETEAVAGPFTIGKYVFDHERQLLQFKEEKKKLTSREADLLRLLCVHLNGVLERDEALRILWGNDSFFNGRSMDVFISRLRKYLQRDKNVEILNVHGKGFKLVVR